MVAIFMFSIFLLKQNQEPQWIVQIIDAIIGFINSPLFAKFGPIGLFVNGVFSTFIPFPPEVTAISLILAGISRMEILAILVTSWIIGAAVGYYTGLSGKELINIFRGKREKTEILKADKDNRNTLSNNASNDNEKIQHKNAETHDDNKKNNENKMRSSSNRYHRLLERYGWAVIFISPWIPIIGDIIPLIAGAKRYEIKKFMIAIAAGKIARAVAVIFFGSYLASLSGQLG